MKRWNILYRGSLTSCNYACDYCPFAKTKNTKEELQKDAKELIRFQNWVKEQKENIGVLITPWGEGLIRKYYQKAMTEMSHYNNVYRIAIQTNISCSLDWIQEVNKKTFGLWTTFHPSQITIDKFLEKCEKLSLSSVRYSVGMVGLKEDFPLIKELKQRLPSNVYMWVNAYKREPNYYTGENISFLSNIDPYFHWNNQYHPSFGKECRAGYTTFSVDGDGEMTRCHFIKTKIGNIYQEGFEQKLKPQLCTNQTCGCHIGYVHMNEHKLNEVYQEGILERIPLIF